MSKECKIQEYIPQIGMIWDLRSYKNIYEIHARAMEI